MKPPPFHLPVAASMQYKHLPAGCGRSAVRSRNSASLTASSMVIGFKEMASRSSECAARRQWLVGNEWTAIEVRAWPWLFVSRFGCLLRCPRFGRLPVARSAISLPWAGACRRSCGRVAACLVHGMLDGLLESRVNRVGLAGGGNSLQPH